MPDWYERYNNWRTRNKNEDEFRKNRRAGNRAERDMWHGRTREINKVSPDEKYREGWDRIFGEKQKDD